MRDIIRSGDTGRCALAFLLFLFTSTACLGQESPAPAQQVTGTQSSDKGDAQAVVTPPADATPPAPQAEGSRGVDTAPVRAAQVQTANDPAPSKGKGKKGSAHDNSGGRPSFTGVQDKPYEVGPEDVLYLNVLHQPDVSGLLEVRPDGFVSVRFAGEIRAAGLTTQQLSDEVAKKLTQYFNHPEVNIQVTRINSKKYYISGEVRRAGAYSLSTPKTVLEALIEAGGLADFAKKKAIYILRAKQKIPFNYSDVSKGKHLEQNILLQNGDVIVVP